MVPVRRLDVISQNTENILSKINLPQKSVISYYSVPESKTRIPFSIAQKNPKFSYIGMDLYREAGLDYDYGKIWRKKEFINPSTGQKESWLVVYTNDEDEIIREVTASLATKGSVGMIAIAIDKILEEKGIAGIPYKIDMLAAQLREKGYDVGQVIQDRDQIPQMYEEILKTVSKEGEFSYDNFGNILYEGDRVRDNGGRTGIVLQTEAPDTILVKWIGEEDVPERIYTGPESTLGILRTSSLEKQSDHYLLPNFGSWVEELKAGLTPDQEFKYVDILAKYGIEGDRVALQVNRLDLSTKKQLEKQLYALIGMVEPSTKTAEVNPKNIPLAPGIKSKNITMDETGGMGTAKVQIEFTDVNKGLEFYQNLAQSEAPKEEEKTPQQQPKPPLAPQQPIDENQAPIPAIGLTPAAASLRSRSSANLINNSLRDNVFQRKIASGSEEQDIDNYATGDGKEGNDDDIIVSSLVRKLGYRDNFLRDIQDSLFRSGRTVTSDDGVHEFVFAPNYIAIMKEGKVIDRFSYPQPGSYADLLDNTESGAILYYNFVGNLEYYKDGEFVTNLLLSKGATSSSRRFSKDSTDSRFVRYSPKLKKQVKTFKAIEKEKHNINTSDLPGPGVIGSIKIHLSNDEVDSIRSGEINLDFPYNLIKNELWIWEKDKRKANRQFDHDDHFNAYGTILDTLSKVEIRAAIKEAIDSADNVSPMSWTLRNNENIPANASPVLPPNPTLQQSNSNVIYDSNKDTGNKFQTVINPDDNSVTVKFLNSQEREQFNQKLQQIQQQSPSLQQPPTQDLQSGQAGQVPASGFSEQEVPVSF